MREKRRVGKGKVNEGKMMKEKRREGMGGGEARGEERCY